MDGREQRGLIIAAMHRQNGAWLVPSESAPDRKYQVKLEGNGTCTCLGCQEGGFICKHIRAVRITLKRELGADGSVTETRQLLFEEKKVYRQDWPAYNAAQRTEKPRFQALLHDLCSGLPEEDRSKRFGRKPHLVRDSVFAMTFKVYSLFSARRFESDLLEAHKQGYLTRTVPGVKVGQFFENPQYTPLLKELIAVSAAPLRCIEARFAIVRAAFPAASLSDGTIRSMVASAARAFGSRRTLPAASRRTL